MLDSDYCNGSAKMKKMGQIIQLQLPYFVLMGQVWAPVPGDPNVKSAGLLTVLLLPKNCVSAPVD